ncbi:hypothetical protein [Prescottella equi]|uniref:hypothetical protein n=1 Tax=Rhodococcus hoagii TaxID=43767 RepID=UPI000A0FADD2|nr:hypothetical protein [Prescottella equi]ORL11466.1 hypothetical protein A6I85_16195 [Prescottella equi]
MNNVVSLRRVPKVAEPEHVSAVVVAGSGGAAATTTAFGLATALRLGTGKEVSAVDATSDGGNLLSRTGVGAVDAARSIRQFQAHMALTSAGVVVVGNGGGQPSDAAIVDELLAARHSARIHDVGTALRSPRLAPLLRSGAALVVVAPARSEPLSRMRDALTWVMSTYGAEVLGRTIVVVSHQMPDAPVDLAPIRSALAPRVAGLVEVPFDAALAQPGVLDHRRLASATLDAWTDALDVLGALSSRLGRSDSGESSSELA